MARCFERVLQTGSEINEIIEIIREQSPVTAFLFALGKSLVKWYN